MNRLSIGITAMLITTTLSLSSTAAEEGWTLMGADHWQERTGPGITLAFGGNDGTRRYAKEVLDTSLFGSAAATLGFNWRLMPILAVYLDGHVAYINTDYNNVRQAAIIEDDRGMLVQATVGAAFHLPVNGWFDLYAGFGMGFAMLRVTGMIVESGLDYAATLKGVNFELKLGGDFYLFSKARTLALGPLFRMGFPVWPSLCIDQQGEDVNCAKPDQQARDFGLDDYGEPPFLVFIGLSGRFGF